MLPAGIAVQTVTRLRGDVQTADAYNDAHVDWSDPEPAVLEGVSVQGELGTEDLNGRNAVTWVFRLFAQPWHDVTAYDRIQLADGRIFDVDGPVVPMGPGTQLEHKVAKLELVVG